MSPVTFLILVPYVICLFNLFILLEACQFHHLSKALCFIAFPIDCLFSISLMFVLIFIISRNLLWIYFVLFFQALEGWGLFLFSNVCICCYMFPCWYSCVTWGVMLYFHYYLVECIFNFHWVIVFDSYII